MNPEFNWSAVVPFLVTGAGALLLVVVDGLLTPGNAGARRKSRGGTLVGILHIGILGAALTLVLQHFASAGYASFQVPDPVLRVDRLSCFGMAAILTGALLSGFLSLTDLSARRIPKGEYYALVLLSVTGMMLLVSATHLLLLVVAIELFALPMAGLVGIDSRRAGSLEAAFKFFAGGNLATALLVLGVVLVYGGTGHLDYWGLRDALAQSRDPLTWSGVALLIGGLGWRLSAAPFHFWRSDAFDGAPTSVGVLLVVGTACAAWVAALRLFSDGLAVVASDSPLPVVLGALAVASLVVGSLLALLQVRLLPLFACVSLVHAGSLLLGIVVASREAFSAALFLSGLWVFFAAGFFAVVMALGLRDERGDHIDRLGGLFEHRPAIAVFLIVFLAALAGVPGTAGFVAKVNLFFAAVAAEQYALAFVGLAAWTLCAFALLRIPLSIVADIAKEKLNPRTLTTAEAWVLGVSAFFALSLGIFPNAQGVGVFAWLRALDWSRSSVAFLF